MKEKLKKLSTEFIGTFFLVFTIAATALFNGDKTLAPLAIGFVLMIMVYSGGHISGGHYNPAVSLAAAIRKALPWTDLIPYWVSQVIGGAAAAFLAAKMAHVTTAPCDPNAFNLSNIVIGEFLFTFALCYVVLLCATTKKTEGNSYFGLAIGATVTVGAVAVGGICLGAFNPAVALALPIIKGCGCGILCCKIAWVTVLVNLIAAVCAAIAFKAVTSEE